MSWILSLQAYCEIQDNVSSIHAIEQKILTLPCRDYKISAHLLQQSHGNRTKTDLHVGKDPLPSQPDSQMVQVAHSHVLFFSLQEPGPSESNQTLHPLPYDAQKNPPFPFLQFKKDPSSLCLLPVLRIDQELHVLVLQSFWHYFLKSCVQWYFSFVDKIWIVLTSIYYGTSTMFCINRLKHMQLNIIKAFAGAPKH